MPSGPGEFPTECRRRLSESTAGRTMPRFDGDIPERPLEHPPAPVQPRPDRADRAGEDVGDLLVGEIVDEVQRGDHPVLLGERVQGPADLLDIELVQEDGRGIAVARLQAGFTVLS